MVFLLVMCADNYRMPRSTARLRLYFLLAFLTLASALYGNTLAFESARRDYRSGNTADALRAFRDIVENDDAMVAESHWYMAKIFVMLDDPEQAFRHFERSLDIGGFVRPEHRVLVYHDLARLYRDERNGIEYERTMGELFAYSDEFTGAGNQARRDNIERVFTSQSLARALELYRLTPGPFADAHYEYGMYLLRSGRDDSLQHLLFYLLHTYSLAIEYYRSEQPRYRFIDLYEFTRDIRNNREVQAFLEERDVYWAAAYLGDAMYFYGGGGSASTRARELWQFVSRQTHAGEASEYAARQLLAETPFNVGPRGR